jgi:phage replication initiation protein
MENLDENLKTPVSDRGVETPYTPLLGDGIEVVIDWFQCTIQHVEVDDVLKRVFNITSEACEHVESGLYGYNNTYVYADKIRILWHKTRIEMGVHIQVSGSACRILEELMPWKLFFDRIMSFDVWKVTRIDIAIDTYKRYFDIHMLKDKIKSGELVSKFKKSTFMEQLNISDGASESASLTFGSMASNMYIVFYDKLAERKNAGFDVDDKVNFWLRSELRFKSELAMELMKLIILNDYMIGDYVQQILYNYIDFKEPCNDSHKHRWVTCDWWLDFLGVVSKLSIAPKSQDSTIVRKRNYAEFYLSKLFAMVRITDSDFFDNLFRNGFKKIGKADLDIINAHFLATGHDIITSDQLKDIYDDIITDERYSYMANQKAKEIVKQIKAIGIGTEYETLV